MAQKKNFFIYLLTLSIVLLIGLFTIIAFQINPIIEQYLNTRLSSLFRDDPSSFYKIGYDSLKIDIYSGDIKVKNLSIKPRKRTLDSLVRNNLNQKSIIDIELSHFKVKNLEWVSFLQTGKIEVESIELFDAYITYYINNTIKGEESASVGNEIFTDNFSSALIHNWELTNANFKLYNVTNDSTLALSFDSLSLTYNELYTDSAMLNTPVGFNVENVRLSLNNLQTGLIENYSVECDNISFLSASNLIKLSGIKLIPSTEKFESMIYLKLDIEEIELNNIQYEPLVYNTQVIAEKVVITNPYIHFVRPPQRIQKDILRYLPATTFKKIPIPLAIDTLEIRDGTFDFLKHGYNEPTVELLAENIYLNGMSFSTDPVLLQKNHTFSIDGKAKFMEQANIDMHFDFPLLHPRDSFSVMLKMDTLDALKLNSILKNSKGLKVNNGTINRLQVAMFGTESLMTGYVSMDYNALKLEIIKVDSSDFSKSTKKGFVSFMVNALAKSDNKRGKSSFNEGIIYTNREPNFTFLDYTLESLMTGIITTMVPESKTFIQPKQKQTGK